jgi:hypothetical protein
MPSLASTTGAAHRPVPAPRNPRLLRRTEPAPPQLLPATLNVNLAHEARSMGLD